MYHAPGAAGWRLGCPATGWTRWWTPCRCARPNARQFHRSLADVNHTVAIWQNLQTRFTEHTGLATPPVGVWEHPDAASRRSGAKVPGVVEGGEVLSLADNSRGGLRLIILNAARTGKNVLHAGGLQTGGADRAPDPPSHFDSSAFRSDPTLLCFVLPVTQ